jgi:NAD(P) transhydrogenase subunit alpha
VTILGPTNLPSEVPQHASQMFSGNVTNFLLNLVKKGQLVLNCDDEIIRETLAAHDGQVVHPRLREQLGLPALEPATLET